MKKLQKLIKEFIKMTIMLHRDGINVDAIIKEVDDTTPSIKKAGGGIARMLGE